MKLATYKDGSRDGQLVVVSRDLSSAHFANGIATRLQQVLDDWNFLSPQLQDLYTTLNHGKARHAFPFDPAMCMAPLPRAFGRLVARASLGHAEHEAAWLGGEPPAQLRSEPLLQQAASDSLLGPCDDFILEAPTDGVDVAAGLAVITGDIARGATPAQALEGVRLLTLAVDWHLRERERAERARGASPLAGQPASGFAPVAVTPEALGEAWVGGRVMLPLQVRRNGRVLGQPDAGAAMHFHFGQLLAAAARGRALCAGTLLGSGALLDADAGHGTASLLDLRAREQAEHGEPRSGWMASGDVLRVEMKGRDGQSLFGALEQGLTDAAA